MELTEEQEAICQSVDRARKSLMVNAYAGTGMKGGNISRLSSPRFKPMQ